MFTYDTVSEALNDLKKRNFNLDFNLSENCLVCNDDKYDVEDFEIKETYRFEGDTDPADEAIVYAIESKNGLKGVLVSGYGASTDEMSALMVKKLKLNRDL